MTYISKYCIEEIHIYFIEESQEKYRFVIVRTKIYLDFGHKKYIWKYLQKLLVNNKNENSYFVYHSALLNKCRKGIKLRVNMYKYIEE